jgi:hypothetical protein
MDIYEYWIGQDIDYASVWQVYEEGAGYIDKFRSMRVHLLRIELTRFPSNLPLFNHEAVYKTIKGYFHDLKLYSLSKKEYMSTGPLFLYSVDRGTGIWNFLGELEPLLALAVTLVEGMIRNQILVNSGKARQILQEYFPDANPDDIERIMQANSRGDLQFALRKLVAQEIQGVKVSRAPFEGDFGATEKTLFDIQNFTMNQVFVVENSFTGDNVEGNKIQAVQDSVVAGRDINTDGDINMRGASVITHGTAYHGRNDLEILTQELSQLREILHGQAIDPEQDVEVGHIAAAEIAARSGDRRATLWHLKNIGAWALDFATKVGASITAEFMKKAMGM